MAELVIIPDSAPAPDPGAEIAVALVAGAAAAEAEAARDEAAAATEAVGTALALADAEAATEIDRLEAEIGRLRAEQIGLAGMVNDLFVWVDGVARLAEEAEAEATRTEETVMEVEAPVEPEADPEASTTDDQTDRPAEGAPAQEPERPARRRRAAEPRIRRSPFARRRR